jgi:hypothetical protein
MKSSAISYITNDNGGFTIKHAADERTPLLSPNNKAVAAVDVVSSKADVGTENDEEAACWMSVTDKQAQAETPRNIAGVISILLIGTYSFFECLQLQQK